MTFKWTSENINRSLREFFESQNEFEDCPDNRAILRQEINNEADGDFSHTIIRVVARDLRDKLKPKNLGLKPVQPPKQGVYSTPENTRVVMAQIGAENPWLNTTSETNLKILFDFLYEHQFAGGFMLDNIRTAVKVLGKSALESVPPPVVAAPPPLPPPIFDWSGVAAFRDIPLTDPDGQPPPAWFLNKLSREQIRSFVKRQQDSNRPAAPILPNGELAPDASQEQLLAATPQMLARFLQRQRAAKYR
jgi:hypothetical protein